VDPGRAVFWRKIASAFEDVQSLTVYQSMWEREVVGVEECRVEMSVS